MIDAPEAQEKAGRSQFGGEWLHDNLRGSTEASASRLPQDPEAGGHDNESVRTNFVLIKHLQETWNRACRENLDPRLEVEKEKRYFTVVLQFDPTDGRYGQWLSLWRRRLWDSRGFRTRLGLQELDQAHDALARFDALRERLPLERRDINLYRTVEDLRSITPSSIVENRRRMEGNALKMTAYAQTSFLFRDVRWMVVSLDAFIAARFWGLGTKWCTTMGEDLYLQYAIGGQLLVFLTPHGKYQLSTRRGDFRDERDQRVTGKTFDKAPIGFINLLRVHRPR